MVVQRFEVFLITLDPAQGREIQKTRPYPSRVLCEFQGKSGEVALDQMRAVDKERLVRRLGVIDSATRSAILEVLARMFAR